MLHWSRTQTQSVSMSSCEAELVALFTAGQEVKFLQTMMSELGIPVEIKIKTDSSSALAVRGRRGLGKLKHIALRLLWLQNASDMTFEHVSTNLNQADLLTKFVMRDTLEKFSQMIGLV